MNTLVIYYSRYGNTKKTAETIAAALNGSDESRVENFQDFKLDMLEGVDLLIMGSPTHIQNLPKDLRPWFDIFPKKCLKGKKIAAYDTSMKMWKPIMWMTASHRLLPKLTKLGGKKLSPPKTFLVDHDEEKHPFMIEGELQRAEAWALELKSKM